MGPFKSKSLTYCGIILLCYYNMHGIIAETGEKEARPMIDDDLDDEDFQPPHQSTGSDFDIEYISPTPNGPVYFSENFDDYDLAKKKWIVSRAQKEESDNVFKYDGRWEFELPQRQIFPIDRALVLRSTAKHAAIAAKLEKKFDFRDKPLFVQYEVNFQNGMDCGGAYIKLLSYSKDLKLDKFQDKTPYTIMFGPDKCGSDVKLHFIFRHKHPINGSFEEKHAKKPSSRVDDIYTDKKPHVYRLVVRPDNSFEVHVDGRIVNKGSLLEDMEPAVNPSKEIEDPNDKKPSDWDEREKIPDPTATKPEDWDDDAPPKIPDPKAIKPDGWLEDEPEMIADENAKTPEDWDESMDGSWEAPLISNPACKEAVGCGPWTAPMVENPLFKGKWKPPMITNANYKGKWTRRTIPNPNYFEDKEPFKMTSIGAVGLEIWTMTDMVLFDNFIITDDEEVVNDWTTQSYDLKRRVLDRDSEGVVSRIVNYSNAHPWLWAIYIFVIGLPLVLFFTFCCGNNQDKKAEEARNKKTDEVTEDDVAPVTTKNSSAPKEKASSFTKVKVATKKDQLEKTENESEEEDEEEEEEEEEEQDVSRKAYDDDDEEEEEEEEEGEQGEQNDEEEVAEVTHSATPPSITKRRTRRE